METTLMFASIFESLPAQEPSNSSLSRDSSFMDEDLPKLPDKLQLKLTMKLCNGTQLPASWLTVDDVSFQSLVEKVQPVVIEAHEEHGDDADIEETDFVMAYKVTTTGLGTAIKSDEDFECFC